MTKKKISIIIALIIIIIGVYFIFSNRDRNLLSVVSCKLSVASCPWYAVHLNNGQVYFGHISYVSDDTISLRDTYSLEAYTQGDNDVSTSTNFKLEKTPTQIYNLARRGDDKTLSSDHSLFINRQAVLFWEKLAGESDVVKLIYQSMK